MDCPTQRLKTHYPWVHEPVIASAPMRTIALAELAVEVSKAGGIGFIGAGSDISALESYFIDAGRLLANSALASNGNQLPLGVGFLNWGAPLPGSLSLIKKYRPAAVWFFAPPKPSDLAQWSVQVAEATRGQTKIWIQIGTVAEALEVVEHCKPDVLVVQGGDAGGHGLNECASIITLLPEVSDALSAKFCGRGSEMPILVAAGGIVDGRGLVAASALGAAGVAMGTRYLAAHEAVIAKGYRNEVLRAADGGVTTVRTSVYDQLRGTTEWPERYGGRSIINRSYVDAQGGMDMQQNLKLYKQAEVAGDGGWGIEGRMTTYAGTGVGLVRKKQSAREITEEVREEARRIFARQTSERL